MDQDIRCTAMYGAAMRAEIAARKAEDNAARADRVATQRTADTDGAERPEPCAKAMRRARRNASAARRRAKAAWKEARTARATAEAAWEAAGVPRIARPL